MTENMQADDVQSSQAVFVRCCLIILYYNTIQSKMQEKYCKIISLSG